MAGNISERELQQMVEEEKARAEQQYHMLSILDRCWSVCLKNRDAGTLTNPDKNCLYHCTQRYVDVMVFTQTKLQRQFQ